LRERSDHEAARGKEYSEKLRRFVKAELKPADVSYKELADRLVKHGVDETESGIASKLARGTFSATFLLGNAGGAGVGGGATGRFIK